MHSASMKCRRTRTPTGVPVDTRAPSPSQVAAHSPLAEILEGPHWDPLSASPSPFWGSPPPGGEAGSGSFIVSYNCLLAAVPQVAGDLLLCLLPWPLSLWSWLSSFSAPPVSPAWPPIPGSPAPRAHLPPPSQSLAWHTPPRDRSA